MPHPCKPNYIWRGVGHRNVLGGGDRNPFGLAFAGELSQEHSVESEEVRDFLLAEDESQCDVWC